MHLGRLLDLNLIRLLRGPALPKDRPRLFVTSIKKKVAFGMVPMTRVLFVWNM